MTPKRHHSSGQSSVYSQNNPSSAQLSQRLSSNSSSTSIDPGTVSTIEFPSDAAVLWAENTTVGDLRRMNQSLTPGYVVKRTLENLSYDERLPERSEKMSEICKRILLTNDGILGEETADLANFMFRHLEHNLHNMAAHRFFLRKTFPSYIKFRGVKPLPSQEQKVSLLRSTNPSTNVADLLNQLDEFEKSMIDHSDYSMSTYDTEVRAIIAHLMIPTSAMEELSHDESIVVKRCLAFNPDTPTQILDTLWKVDDEITSLTVAGHKNTSFDTLQQILRTLPNSKAVKIALNNSSWDSDTLDRLAVEQQENRKSINWNVLRGVAGNHNISMNAVLLLIENDFIDDLELVYNLLANRNVNSVLKELLKSAMKDYLAVH